MLLLIRFSRRRLRAFVMPSFLLHVFAKLPLIFSLESGCIGGGSSPICNDWVYGHYAGIVGMEFQVHS